MRAGAAHPPVTVPIRDDGREDARARARSASIGGVEYSTPREGVAALMDLYRDRPRPPAHPKLAACRARRTMLTLTGANQFMEIHADAAAAVKSF